MLLNISKALQTSERGKLTTTPLNKKYSTTEFNRCHRKWVPGVK